MHVTEFVGDFMTTEKEKEKTVGTAEIQKGNKDGKQTDRRRTKGKVPTHTKDKCQE